MINIEKFAHCFLFKVQSWDSDIEVEIKKHGSLNSLGISMDGQDIPLFNCIGIFPKGILVFVDFVTVIRMNASLYLLNAIA